MTVEKIDPLLCAECKVIVAVFIIFLSFIIVFILSFLNINSKHDDMSLNQNFLK